MIKKTDYEELYGVFEEPAVTEDSELELMEGWDEDE